MQGKCNLFYIGNGSFNIQNKIGNPINKMITILTNSIINKIGSKSSPNMLIIFIKF